MTHSTTSRLVSSAERVAIGLLITYLCIHTLPRAWKSLVTDFPNYYLVATIAHEGEDTARMYEWRWLEREKDHRGIEVEAVGIVPLTPFSTLLFRPLIGLDPLTAKRVWIVFNLLLAIPIGWMLRSLTGLSYQRIALIFALCFPYYRNLEYGQFYVFLLLIIVAACWFYVRGLKAPAGVLVALAAACKIFPVLLLVFFLQRRAWRALGWAIGTGLVAVLISVGVFGTAVHRTYLFEILPWAMHGEAMPPYAINASLSGVLHVLFLPEPQWNPHPWHSSVLAYALIFPALQMILLAPAILLISRQDCSRERILLEWAAITTASLAVSTLPASYHFVVMIFPMCVLSAMLLQRRRFWLFGLLLIAFAGISFPMPHPSEVVGMEVLLYVPRLILMIGLLAGIYVNMGPKSHAEARAMSNWTQFAWAGLLIFDVLLTSRSTFQREGAVRQEYAYRLPLRESGILNADPQNDGTSVRYVAFLLNGYKLLANDSGLNRDVSDRPGDVLSFATLPGHLWLENASYPQSTIVDLNTSHPVVVDGHNPMPSHGGGTLAFLRDEHGRGRLMIHSPAGEGPATDRTLSPTSLDVYEASVKSEKEFVFAASVGEKAPELYLTDGTHSDAPLGLTETRYPALSPDGLWLAYSHLDHGVWNLWLRNERTGLTRRVGDVPCNQIEASWESDSKTILYSTDCGRGLWFTAVSRRQIIP